jgi:hypothetical protein
MGRLNFGMMQSLDGYIAGPSGGPQLFAPGPILHRHFNDYVRGLETAFSTADTCMRLCVTGTRTSRSGTRSNMISPKSGVRSRSGLHHVL